MKKMHRIVDFAILAPVPLEHLKSGKAIAKSEGFVAFGSRKWDLFRKVDELRHGERVPVLLYPSHDYESPARLDFMIAWFGWYVGHVEAVGGAHPEGMRHRPPTTLQYPDDNRGHWVVFWHVEGLLKLRKSDQFPISTVGTYKGGTWHKDAVPRGPELVAVPNWLELQNL